MEAGALTALVEIVLASAWRRESEWHGEHHWRCVTATGLELAGSAPAADVALGVGAGEEVGVGRADRTLVFCFGLLHDTRRVNEAVDPEHGPRAAALGDELYREGALPLDAARFARLAEALRLHSNGLVSADPTIGTCWDADRLHLPRVSIQPRTELFSTLAAHGEAPLAAAEALRIHGPPAWDALVASVGAGGG